MSAETMQSIFDQLGAGGWPSIEVDQDKLQQDMQKMIAEQREEAIPVAATFSTPAGQKTLLWLMEKTLLKPPGPDEYNAKSAEEYALRKARRDGQNGVVFVILHALQVAAGEQSTGGEL